MFSVAEKALEAATRRGVTFADVRVENVRERYVSTRNGQPATVSASETLGVGIRVFLEGCQGFAATDDLSPRGIERAAALAVEIARSGRIARKSPIDLVPEGAWQAEWFSPCRVDPFAVGVDEYLSLLASADAEMGRVSGVTLTESSITATRRKGVYVNSDGSRIAQTRTATGAGICAYSFREDELQKRSYPNSFGGQYQLKGFELAVDLDLPGHAGPLAEQAVALHSADPCPDGVYDVILDSSQLGLQIHESVGHPIELDRVLGSEANYAGLSFLAPSDAGVLRYGSPIVNLVADATNQGSPGGLGTFAFDDEGVPAQCIPIVTEGLFRGFLSSRESAAAIRLQRSGGCMRAEGWNRVPLVRMTNVSLLPGPHSLDEVLTDGIYMETNRSWSIDDKRYNFQFGCEIGWEMRDGRRVRMLKNPTYSGISTEFWNSCSAIAGPEHWTLWGVPNCGKGQPEQVMGTGHGASPARFARVRVGSAALDV